MTTAQTLTAQLSAAARAVAQAWGLADALSVNDITGTTPDVAFAGHAVVVEFSGRVSGLATLLVDSEIGQQLMDSPAAPSDLIEALAPATTAACMVLGDVVISSSRLADPAAAVAEVSALADHGVATLLDDGEVRAALVMGFAPAAAETPAETRTSIPSQVRGPVTATMPSAGRLDLLRGVQMEATVELGRTTMTINDLLALRSGNVVELDRAAGAPADLYVNGRLIAQGEVVVVDENYGLRILHVVSDDMPEAR